VEYLKEQQLGDDLLSAETEDDGEYKVLTVSISDAAKERILAEASLLAETEFDEATVPVAISIKE
jgi:hypothetical protein